MLNFQLARVNLAAPAIIYLNPTGGLRPRVWDASAAASNEESANDVPTEITYLDAAFVLNVVTKTVHAQLAPIPTPLLIYGAEDFAAVAADTPEQHAERVLQVLGSDPASTLQALIDGTELPAQPIRIPREIPNWRAKVILARMGLLTAVDAAISSLPEPEHTVASLAWAGDAKLARTGKTVLALAAALGLTSEQLDALFLAAEALEV